LKISRGNNMKIIVIHGPNLNLLGTREPEHYGSMTLKKINNMIMQYAKKEKIEIDIFNSNHEGEIIDIIHGAIETIDGIIINPGAFTHTSIAIRDALLACGIPTIEVHLSNIYQREEFRHRSYISDIALGVITGLKEQGYILAIKAFKNILNKKM
jgi:3-dehydroquinate dehydratase-2